MPTARIAMRKVREILRRTYDAGLPSREVARRVGVGSTGVRMMLQRFGLWLAQSGRPFISLTLFRSRERNTQRGIK